MNCHALSLLSGKTQRHLLIRHECGVCNISSQTATKEELPIFLVKHLLRAWL